MIHLRFFSPFMRFPSQGVGELRFHEAVEIGSGLLTQVLPDHGKDSFRPLANYHAKPPAMPGRVEKAML